MQRVMLWPSVASLAYSFKMCVNSCVVGNMSAGYASHADTVVHYEFMQDYKVHIKHTDGSFEYIPYFCLPANELNDVIAPSCYSCFDYPNALADLVVGTCRDFTLSAVVPHLQAHTLRSIQ